MSSGRAHIPFHGFLSDLSFWHVPDAVIAEARFDPSAFDPALFHALDIPRPNRIDTSSAKRQADFLAGRLVARAALEAFGTTPQHIPAGPDRAPVWPCGVNGSISHTNQACAALVANSGMLCGIDCEQFASGSALDAIFERCLSKREQRWIQAQTSHPHDVLATLVFSAKESIFKALAPTVQHFFGFDCAEVQGWSDDTTLAFELTETLHRDYPKGFQLHACCRLDERFARTWILAHRHKSPSGQV